MRINCAKCGGPVERIEVWNNYARGCQVVVAYCHGAEDRMIITITDLTRLGLDAIRQMQGGLGMAFTSHADLLIGKAVTHSSASHSP